MTAATAPATTARPPGRPRNPIEHGTNNGWQTENRRRRNGEPPPPENEGRHVCPDCRAAHNRHERDHYTPTGNPRGRPRRKEPTNDRHAHAHD